VSAAPRSIRDAILALATSSSSNAAFRRKISIILV
jgi:hypothetical protein